MEYLKNKLYIKKNKLNNNLIFFKNVKNINKKIEKEYIINEIKIINELLNIIDSNSFNKRVICQSFGLVNNDEKHINDKLENMIFSIKYYTNILNKLSEENIIIKKINSLEKKEIRNILLMIISLLIYFFNTNLIFLIFTFSIFFIYNLILKSRIKNYKKRHYLLKKEIKYDYC